MTRPSSLAASLLAAGLVVALLVVAGSAQAFWTGGGGGPGTGGTATTLPVTLSQGVPDADLYPGGSADVVLTVSNPNPTDVRLGSLVPDPDRGDAGFAVDAGHTGCATSALALADQMTGWTVPGATSGGDGTRTITLIDALTMDVDAANACQGASFVVYLRSGA